MSTTKVSAAPNAADLCQSPFAMQHEPLKSVCSGMGGGI